MNFLNLSRKESKRRIEKMRDEIRGIQRNSKQLLKSIEDIKIKEEKEEKKLLICPKCKKEVRTLTTEHKIPKWIFNPNKLHILGLKELYKGKWSNISSRNKIKICRKCNLEKGGYFDFTDKDTREFVKNIIKVLQKKLDETR